MPSFESLTKGYPVFDTILCISYVRLILSTKFKHIINLPDELRLCILAHFVDREYFTTFATGISELLDNELKCM